MKIPEPWFFWWIWSVIVTSLLAVKAWEMTRMRKEDADTE